MALVGRHRHARGLGTVSLPRLDVLEIGEDYVMGVHRDDVDVEYIRVYDLHKAPRATGGT